MDTVDYNVEFAHLYLAPSSAPIGREQLESVQRTKPVVASLRQQGLRLALSLLVDDYHGGSAVDNALLVEGLASAGLAPDFIMPESALTGVADHLIELLPPKFLFETSGSLFLSTLTRDPLLWASPPRSEGAAVDTLVGSAADRIGDGGAREQRNSAIIHLKSLGHGRAHHSCALLTACWHLMRMGVTPFAGASGALYRRSEGAFFAQRLLTVLPTNYLKVESAAIEIMMVARSKRIRRCKDALEYVFF